MGRECATACVSGLPSSKLVKFIGKVSSGVFKTVLLFLFQFYLGDGILGLFLAHFLICTKFKNLAG